MNTSKLKTFAQSARNTLLDGVARKLLYWGLDEKGAVVEAPQEVQGGLLHRGQAIDDPTLKKKWDALRSAVGRKGFQEVCEEAAYTWFNRLMAIRILAKNGYEPAQLEYGEGQLRTPLILQRARRGQYDFLSEREQQRLRPLLTDYERERDAFGILLIGYCHHHPLLHRVFGGIDDYTELLLPDDILADNGFLHTLNTTEAITDEDYRQVELIGWLYQFYISEKKDEVFKAFKKRKKAEAKDIPAATQIFTPNWIVKYMVENTVGRLWLDLHPDSPLREKMKYLVEPADQEGDSDAEGGQAAKSEKRKAKSDPIISEVAELKLLDPACGSGHILVEGFELLYDMYMEEYYTPEEAVTSILQNNLFGLDIDKRAVQLAQFAVLLKAAKYYPDVLQSPPLKEGKAGIYSMPEPAPFSRQEILDFLGPEGKEYEKELSEVLELMKQAKNLGTVIQFELEKEVRDFIFRRYKELQGKDLLSLAEQLVLVKLGSFVPILSVLTDKYEAVAANPPYLSSSNMNRILKSYVNEVYPLSKLDLFAVFIEVSYGLTIKNGFVGMINQHTWMFLSSYKKLREYLLDNINICSLLHLGPRVFEELSGEVVQSVAFSIRKTEKEGLGVFYRLVNYRESNDKKRAFLNEENIIYNVSQNVFQKIPGKRIGYWVNKTLIEKFKKVNISNNFSLSNCIQPGSSEKFLRQWHEVNYKKIEKKWFITTKGGTFRRWYGNLNHVINFEDNGRELRKHPSSILRGEDQYGKSFVSWTRVGSNIASFRYSDSGILATDAGPVLYNPNHELVGFLNTKVCQNILDLLNPTFNVQVGDVKSIPLIKSNDKVTSSLAKDSIAIAKKDWNSLETSLNFQKNVLLNDQPSLEKAFEFSKKKKVEEFFKLHDNEEKLNKIFINIYGLLNEIVPYVPLTEVTILQEELDFDTLEASEYLFRQKGPSAIDLPIKRDVVMQQLISYAVGCMMGRYRLDEPGLHIAHPEPSPEEVAKYEIPSPLCQSLAKSEFGSFTRPERSEGGRKSEEVGSGPYGSTPRSEKSEVLPVPSGVRAGGSRKEEEVGNQTTETVMYEIDDDAIIPLMGSACSFSDDAVQRFKYFLEVVWGEETLTQNLNFLQECLDMDLEKYMVKYFWRDHCRRYKKTPIYWLFASPKGAFQVLVYMHRMNRFTVEKIRSKYLLPHLRHLESRIARLEERSAELSRQEARELDTLRKDLVECRDYDLLLKDKADRQITFDLDDGVKENYKLFEGVVARIR